MYLRLFIVATALVAGCTRTITQPPLERTLIVGREVYGLVVGVASGVDTDPNVTENCVKPDALCTASLSDARKQEFATVHLHSALFVSKVVVPRGRVAAGDIIRLKMPPRDDLRPAFVDIGARAADRNPSTCDWVDGDPASRKGGVACRGWSYKTIRPNV
jgi:hypothetical protein